jgi:hypothetical protein
MVKMVAATTPATISQVRPAQTEKLFLGALVGVVIIMPNSTLNIS